MDNSAATHELLLRIVSEPWDFESLVTIGLVAIERAFESVLEDVDHHPFNVAIDCAIVIFKVSLVGQELLE